MSRLKVTRWGTASGGNRTRFSLAGDRGCVPIYYRRQKKRRSLMNPASLAACWYSCSGSSVKPRARLIWRLEIRCGRSQSARLHQATVSGCTDEECAVKKFGDRHNALIKHKSRLHYRSGSCAQRKTLRHPQAWSPSLNNHTHTIAPRLLLVNHSSSSSSPAAKFDNMIAVLANSR